MELKTFKVSFKSYYRELCDWGSEYVKARNRRTALRKFATKHVVKSANCDDPEDWRWWEGDWYHAFHLIEEVARTPRICGHCKGAGLTDAG